MAIENKDSEIEEMKSAKHNHVNELSNDVKKVEMKLRKMRERRNHYKGERETFKERVNEMQKDNELMFNEVTIL